MTGHEILILILGLVGGGIIGYFLNWHFYKKAKKETEEVKKWLLTFEETEVHPFEDKADFYKNQFKEGSRQERIRRYFEDIQSMAHNSRERINKILENIHQK